MVGEELRKALEYYNVSVREISKEILLKTTITSFLGALVVKTLSIQLEEALLLIGLLAVITSIQVPSRYLRMLSEEKSILDLYSPLIINQLYMHYLATGSLYKAIKRIADSKIPFASKGFLNVISMVVQGENPADALKAYAETQPSEIFRRGILNFISLTSKGMYVVDYAASEFNLRLRKRCRELELKATVFTTLIYFTPILALMAAQFNGLDWRIQLIIPAIQLLLSELTHRRLIIPGVLKWS